MPLEPVKPQLHELRRIRAVAAYQFGRGAERAFPRSLLIVRSPNTHRIRHIYNDGKLLATYRPKDGLLALTVNGGLALKRGFKAPKLRVRDTPEVEAFIRKGGNGFAKHVIGVDPELRPEEEDLVVDNRDRLLAVWRSVLNAME